MSATAAVSQQAIVAQTLRETGGTFPESVTNPRLAGPAYSASISEPLAGQIQREMASPPDPASVAAGIKILGLDAAAARDSVGRLLQACGIVADPAKLSAGTLAALKAVADSAERAAAYRSR